MSIDRNSPIPLYYQLKQILLASIESGEFQAGDILPTETQIQETYDVSRTTVRQALSELETEGKISRYRGRGTFVSRPKISHNPDLYPSLADHLLQEGSRAGWKVLSAKWTVPPPDVAKALHINDELQVFSLKRLRLVNDHPIGLHVAYVSPYFASGIDQNAFENGGSLRYLRGIQGIDESNASRIIEAIPAGHEESHLLSVPKGAAMLQIRRVVVDKHGKPIEVFRGIYRGDRFQYHITNMRAVSEINA